MKKLRKTVIATLLGILLYPASAEPMNHHQGELTIEEPITVNARVDKVMNGNQMVRLKSFDGTRFEVPIDALPLWRNQNLGFDQLRSGTMVTAQAQPGMVSLSPAQRDKVWIEVDGEKFMRVDPAQLHDGLFQNDERTVTLDNGTEVEISLAETLKDRAEEQVW